MSELTDEHVRAELREDERKGWAAAPLLPEPGGDVLRDCYRKLAAERIARREERAAVLLPPDTKPCRCADGGTAKPDCWECKGTGRRPIRMEAYYYAFEPTGVTLIDRILSAVACAGKAYHHTEAWGDEGARQYEAVHRGDSCVAWIQYAANDAAAALRAARPTPPETGGAR